MSEQPKLERLQREFAGHIRDPEHRPAPTDVDDRRMAVYRDLFYNNIQGFLANNFPVIRKLYPDPDWHALVRDFFINHRAHTPLFPELPREFLKYLEKRRDSRSGDPDFLLELAHYEWVELALSLDESEPEKVRCDSEGDLLQDSPVLSPAAWLLSYRYPVHRIRPDYQPDAPPAEATHLVVYRRLDDRVHFMQLNAITARLLERLRDRPGQSGLSHLSQIAIELDRPVDQLTAPGLAALEDLKRRQVILGTASAAQD